MKVNYKTIIIKQLDLLVMFFSVCFLARKISLLFTFLQCEKKSLFFSFYVLVVIVVVVFIGLNFCNCCCRSYCCFCCGCTLCSCSCSSCCCLLKKLHKNSLQAFWLCCFGCCCCWLDVVLVVVVVFCFIIHNVSLYLLLCFLYYNTVYSIFSSSKESCFFEFFDRFSLQKFCSWVNCFVVVFVFVLVGAVFASCWCCFGVFVVLVVVVVAAADVLLL